MKKIKIQLFFSLLLLSGGGTAQNIYPFAGGSGDGFSGDGGLSTAAVLYNPMAVAADAAGNIFICDKHRLRKISSAGIISTIAGTGIAGFNTDGIDARLVLLNHPRGVAVDAAGNVFVADKNNNRIRKINSFGVITTIAGTGAPGFSGDGAAATAAMLNAPCGIVFDVSGNLYIADSSNHRIRKINANGVISTIAGVGTAAFFGDGGQATGAGLNGPSGVAFGGAGAIYIADGNNFRIRKVSSSGMITTVAGNGSMGYSGDGAQATAAQINVPRAIAADQQGNLFIADANNNRIRKVNSLGIITTLAGTGTPGYSGDGAAATGADLNAPQGVAADGAGTVYVADMGNSRIRRISSAGTISTAGGGGLIGFGGDGFAATGAQLNYPTAVAFDTQGNAYIADAANHRVRKVSAGGVISTLAGTGTGGYNGDGGPAMNAQLYSPSGVAADAAGNVYVSDFDNNRIRKIDAGGIISTFAGTGAAGFSGDGGQAALAKINNPYGITIDAAGNVYFAEFYSNRIRKVDAAGIISTFAGTGVQGSGGDGGPAVNAQFYYPQSVSAGPSGNIYIADMYNGKVRKVDVNGTITTFAGTGTTGFSGDGGPAINAQFSSPRSVAEDALGNVYISDANNDRIRKVDGSGTISTFAGTGAIGFSGDGGPALNARFYTPVGLAIDAGANLFIADQNNHRIRKICLPGCLVGIHALHETNKLVLFPNPARGFFNIQLDYEISKGEIILINATGQEVHRQPVSRGLSGIALPALSKGLYTCILMQDNRKAGYAKLMIEE